MSAMAAGYGHEVPYGGLVPDFRAQNELERAVASDLDIQRGWNFAVEGAGHPERLVGAHVGAILRNIRSDDALASALRFVALVTTR